MYYIHCRSLKLDKLGTVKIEDFKSLINLYIEYINYEIKREDSQPNVEEEVNKRFLTGVQVTSFNIFTNINIVAYIINLFIVVTTI
jgi:hypothetical protein